MPRKRKLFGLKITIPLALALMASPLIYAVLRDEIASIRTKNIAPVRNVSIQDTINRKLPIAITGNARITETYQDPASGRLYATVITDDAHLDQTIQAIRDQSGPDDKVMRAQLCSHRKHPQQRALTNMTFEFRLHPNTRIVRTLTTEDMFCHARR